jgi:hypothetical protein
MSYSSQVMPCKVLPYIRLNKISVILGLMERSQFGSRTQSVPKTWMDVLYVRTYQNDTRCGIGVNMATTVL